MIYIYNFFIVILFLINIFNIDSIYAISSDNALFHKRNPSGMELKEEYGGEKIGNGSINTNIGLFGLIYAWTNFFLGLLGIIILLLIIISGIQILMSGQDEAKRKKWLKMLVNMIIAFVILLLSYVIVRFLVSGFINNPLQ